MAAACLWLARAGTAFAGVYQGPVDEATWQRMLGEVDSAREALAEMIARAEAQGIPTEYARVSLVTIDLFRGKFAPWDRAHPAEVQAMYDAKYFSRHDPVGPVRLPFDELADCIEVADTAMAELERQLQGSLRLVRPPDFSADDIRLVGAYYRLRGRVVFPSYFFWHPFEEDLMQAYGRSGEGYLAVTDLGPDGHVRSWRHDALVDLIRRQADARRAPIQFFLGHVVGEGAWQRLAHPKVFAAGGRLFTDYDIDHPLVREWLETLFAEQMAPAVAACGDKPRVHMMANEPAFPMREGGVQAENGVSGWTMTKFRAWLQAKYGSIDAVNQLYGTAWGDFGEATMPLPMPLSLQGGARWYDWCRFNMDRVNEWFAWLHERIHAVDPDGKTHVKLMGERSVHFEYRDEGLDFESIVRLVDMPGTDSQMTPADAEWDVRFDQSWRGRYCLEWRAQAIMLDFIRSLAPGKPCYDSEWHGLSGSRWRAFHMDRRYVRAALWLAFSGGL
ncbi:MAG: glycoside hydrolase family 42, partial [Verrucomicrobia bacterium]